MNQGFVEYKVCLSWDEETSQMVAAIPALGISDYGPDTNAALDNLRQMASFHLECLLEEGEQVPGESDEDAGLFIRVQLPSRAA